MPVETPPIQRRPAAVDPASEVRDEDVRVQLRIAGARRPMPKRSSHQPRCLLHDRPTMPTPNRSGRSLQVNDGLPNGDVVCCSHLPAQLIVAHPEEDADALRRREGQIEACDPRDARRGA
jgi:hypothetical protein